METTWGYTSCIAALLEQLGKLLARYETHLRMRYMKVFCSEIRNKLPPLFWSGRVNRKQLTGTCASHSSTCFCTCDCSLRFLARCSIGATIGFRCFETALPLVLRAISNISRLLKAARSQLLTHVCVCCHWIDVR